MRVLIAKDNKAGFRADGVKNIFVEGISSNHRKIKSLKLVFKNNKVKYSIDNNLNTWFDLPNNCLLYTSPSPRDRTRSRMPSSA